MGFVFFYTNVKMHYCVLLIIRQVPHYESMSILDSTGLDRKVQDMTTTITHVGNLIDSYSSDNSFISESDFLKKQTSKSANI